MNHRSRAHEAKAVDLLSSFQLVEHLLKVYIVAAGVIEEYRGRSSDDQSHAAVKDLPLGLLIRKFERVNANKGLHGRLKGLRGLRNSIAHQALLYRYAFLQGLIADFDVHVADIDRDAPKVKIVLDEVLFEFEQILGEFREAAAWKKHQQETDR